MIIVSTELFVSIFREEISLTEIGVSYM